MCAVCECMCVVSLGKNTLNLDVVVNVFTCVDVLLACDLNEQVGYKSEFGGRNFSRFSTW